jgi:hypothetical protein
MTRKYLFAALAIPLYLAAAPASATRLECTVHGDTVRLTEEGDTLWFELPGGVSRGLQINRAMSDRHTLVAAATVGGGSTSVIVTDGRDFQQTFVTAAGQPLFVEGTCK